jgi:hypothetical protein
MFIITQVASHHEDLLSQAASANNLSGSLTSVQGGLTDLESSLEKSVIPMFNNRFNLTSNGRLRLKIRVPYQSLQTNVTRLQKLQQASDVLRRTSRFVVLARRLQTQMADMNGNSVTNDKSNKVGMNGASDSHGLLGQGHDLEDEKERTIAKAALSIAELGERPILQRIRFLFRTHIFAQLHCWTALVNSPRFLSSKVGTQTEPTMMNLSRRTTTLRTQFHCALSRL